MKKMFFLFFTLLTVLTGCNIFNVDEECTVNTEYDASRLTVSPAETTVSRGKIVKLVFANISNNVVTEIKVDGNPVRIPSDGILYVTANSDHVVVFTSKEVAQYYILRTSGDQGVTISPSGQKVIPQGQSIDLELNSLADYFIDSLIIDGVGTKLQAGTTKLNYKFTANDNLEHTFRGVSKKREVYTISSTAGEYGTILPLGEISVLEGQTKPFQIKPNDFCSLLTLKVDGVQVSNTLSHTFSDIHENHSIEAKFKREIEWYFNGTSWKVDSTIIDGYLYDFGEDVWSFSSDGKYIDIANGQTYHRNWSLDKTTNPITLKCSYGSCKLLLLNDQKMIISYINSDKDEVKMIFKRV